MPSPHLTIDQITARVNGASIDADASEHLAACAGCRDEMLRWSTVAEAVRSVAPQPATAPREPLDRALAAISGVPAAIPGVPAAIPGVTVPRRPLLAGRRTALLSTAAALVTIAAVGVGVGLGAHRSATQLTTGRTTDTTNDTASLVSATECPTLKVAAGALASVNGTTLVLRTASGKSITVTTDKSTSIVEQVNGGPGDIVNGASVMVRGTGDDSGDAITAQQVAIMPGTMKLPQPASLGGGLNLSRTMAAHGTAMGTVSDAGPGGFVVTARDGTRVRVTTSSSTPVIKQVTATVAGLKTGAFTVAVGRLGSNGVLAASTVQQDTLTQGAEPAKPSLGAGMGGRLPGAMPTDMPRDLRPSALPTPPPGSRFSGLGCDATSIANTAAFDIGG